MDRATEERVCVVLVLSQGPKRKTFWTDGSGTNK